MSNKRKSGTRSRRIGPSLECGWQDGTRVYKGGMTGNRRRRFTRVISMLPCRTCGVKEYEMCKAQTGKEAELVHSSRVDDAWEVLRGVSDIREVLSRGSVATPAWPEPRRMKATTL